MAVLDRVRRCNFLRIGLLLRWSSSYLHQEPIHPSACEESPVVRSYLSLSCCTASSTSSLSQDVHGHRQPRTLAIHLVKGASTEPTTRAQHARGAQARMHTYMRHRCLFGYTASSIWRLLHQQHREKHHLHGYITDSTGVLFSIYTRSRTASSTISSMGSDPSVYFTSNTRGGIAPTQLHRQRHSGVSCYININEGDNASSISHAVDGVPH